MIANVRIKPNKIDRTPSLESSSLRHHTNQASYLKKLLIPLRYDKNTKLVRINYNIKQHQHQTAETNKHMKIVKYINNKLPLKSILAIS